MLVRELIEKLKEYNQDLPIALAHNVGSENQMLSNIFQVLIASINQTDKYIIIIDETTKQVPRASTITATEPEGQNNG